MIKEDELILCWMNTMYARGRKSVDTDVYMALRFAIREYNQTEEDNQQEPEGA